MAQNGISKILQYKRDPQDQKLALAGVDRTNLLALSSLCSWGTMQQSYPPDMQAMIISMNIIDNPNTGGLKQGRSFIIGDINGKAHT